MLSDRNVRACERGCATETAASSVVCMDMTNSRNMLLGAAQTSQLSEEQEPVRGVHEAKLPQEGSLDGHYNSRAEDVCGLHSMVAAGMYVLCDACAN